MISKTARAQSLMGVALGLAALFGLVACHDVSDFSTVGGGVYEGSVTSADFVRAGIGTNVEMCLTIDTAQLQGSPGLLSTSDGLFRKTSLRSIPQFWSDPLSTFNFGEGRIQNVLYMAAGNANDAGPGGDVLVILSFMVGGNIEVRLIRGAPDGGASSPITDAGGSEGGDAGAALRGPTQIFGVFSLNRSTGTCPF